MSSLLERLKSSLAGRYDIGRELGRGGMAVVLLARDLKHDREVAIKVLLPELAASIGGDRFLREIQTAAKLSHAHILPLFDSGDADGLLFYVMPYVAGESLAARLESEGPLPLDDALRIGREVAEALAYAHRLGIVHRDIKPSNVMLDSGHARVTDFGIAKALSAAGADQLTGTGTLIGTVSYMAPEQAAGDRVDGRADLYSLGCTLFEVLAGHVPFSGSAQAMIARHTLEPAPSLVIVRSTVPPDVDAIVLKALAKSPADRFRDAEEMARALADAEAGVTLSRPRPARSRGVPSTRLWRALTGAAAVGLIAWGAYSLANGRGGGPLPGGVGPDPRRVAVTYFADMSRDGRLTPLADGLTESLIARLGPVRDLDVSTPGAVAQFRGTDASRDSIARALDVGTIVEGMIEEDGPGLRVTVRLVDGASSAEFARRAITMGADDAVAIRDSVTLQVEQFLRERLGEELALRAGRDETSDASAWSAYARAERMRKDAEAEVIAEHMDAAMTLFDRADSSFAIAAELDAGWARPLVARADVAGRMAWFSSADLQAFDVHTSRGLRLADEALARDPGSPSALSERGWLKYVIWSFSELPAEDEERLLLSAEDDLVAAINGDNSIARAHLMRGLILGNRGEIPAANLSFRQAWDADPYLREANDILNFLVLSSLDLETFSDGARYCEVAHQRFPEDYRFISCGLRFMIAPGQPADVDRAWALLDELERHSPPTFQEFRRRDWTMMVAGVLAKAGMSDSAKAVLGRARGNPDIDPDRELLLSEAYVHVLLNDHDAAFDALSAYMAANPSHRFVDGEPVHWRWRPLIGDARFRTLAMPAAH